MDKVSKNFSLNFKKVEYFTSGGVLHDLASLYPFNSILIILRAERRGIPRKLNSYLISLQYLLMIFSWSSG